MIDNIVRSIATAISTTYHTGYTIYSEAVKQGFSHPCFFIACLNQKRKKISIGREKSDLSFNVHFFPSQANANYEMQEVGQKLFDILEKIETHDGDIYHGHGMSFETVDDVLHFFVSFKAILKNEDESVDMMQSVTLEVK